MALTDALRAKMLALNAVAAITTKIRPHQMGQLDGNGPAITISVSDDIPPETLDRDGGSEAMVVIKSISTNKTQSKQLANAIQTNGTDPGTGLDGCQEVVSEIDIDCVFEHSTETTEPFEDGSDKVYHCVEATYSVWYRDDE